MRNTYLRRNMVLVVVFLAGCSLKEPIAPVFTHHPASDTIFAGMQKAVRGLEYYEQFYHIRHAFMYNAVESLSFNLAQLNFSLSAECITSALSVLPQQAYAKQAQLHQAQASGGAGLPFSALYAPGDSVASCSVDSFFVVIRRCAAVRIGAPVDSGYDSLFYLAAALHHINSRLYLAGGRTAFQQEIGADSTGSLGAPADSARLSWITRWWNARDTAYAARVLTQYGPGDTVRPVWHEYREYAYVGTDTLLRRTVTRIDGTPLLLVGNEDITDRITRYRGGAEISGAIIKRRTTDSNTVNAAVSDGYIAFEEWKNAPDSLYALWKDFDKNSWLYRPGGSDTAEVQVKYQYTTGEKKEEYALVRLTPLQTNAPERILGQYVVDSLADGTVFQVRMNYNSWTGDTINVDASRIYSTRSLVDTTYGRPESTAYEIRLTCPAGTSTPLLLSLYMTDYFASTNTVRNVSHDFKPGTPADLSRPPFKAGRYVKTATYRMGPTTSQQEDFTFDLTNQAAPDSVWCTWKKLTRKKTGDTLTQTVRVNAAGKGTYTELRSDPVAERMSFDNATGAFADTVWTGPAGSMQQSRILSGTMNIRALTGQWFQKRPGADVALAFGPAGLTITGNDTVLGDSLGMALAGPNASWGAVIDDYAFTYTYSFLPGELIDVFIEGRRLPDSLLKVRSAELCITPDGKDSGFVRVADPQGNAVVNDSAAGCIDYGLTVNLRGTSQFSRRSLF